MKFPRAHSPFAPLKLCDSDKNEVLKLADSFVQQTLTSYETGLDVQHGVVNESRWKMIKHFEDVVVYQGREVKRPRCFTRAEAKSNLGYGHRESLNKVQKLLWFGTVQGSLDDVMYGVINPTAEEAKVKAAHIGTNVLDFAVLDTVVHPTAADPFQGLQIKWAVNGGPSIMRSLVRCRDFVYLESTGVTTSSTGERIGYHILHSVAVPGAPELHEHKLVRGNMTMYHLYRQKSEGVVETYAKACTDVMGNIPSSIATFMSAKCISSVQNLGDYATMKKLMWILKQKRSIPSHQTGNSMSCHVCHEDVSGALTRKHTCCVCLSYVCSRCCLSKKLHHMTPLSYAVIQASVAVCTLCMGKVLTTSCLEVAMDEATKNSQHRDIEDHGSTKDTSSPSSTTSSHVR